MTQRDFAARHGLGLSTLNRWLRVASKAAPPMVKIKEVTLPNTCLPSANITQIREFIPATWAATTAHRNPVPPGWKLFVGQKN